MNGPCKREASCRDDFFVVANAKKKKVGEERKQESKTAPEILPQRYQALPSTKRVFNQMTHVLCVTTTSPPAKAFLLRQDGMIAIADASVQSESRPPGGTICPRLIFGGQAAAESLISLLRPRS